MNQDQMLQVAKAMVEAVFSEFMLWVHASPLNWKRYEKLRTSVAINKLYTSNLSSEERALAATQPFWGSSPTTEKLREQYEEILVDKDLQALMKRAFDSIAEHQDEK